MVHYFDSRTDLADFAAGYREAHRAAHPRSVCVVVLDGDRVVLRSAVTGRVRRVIARLHRDVAWPPRCGHSACRQHYIDTGGTECVETEG